MRPQLSRLSKSKAALIGAASIAAVAVVGTTVGYASLSAAATSVTLNVDGHVEHVTSAGDTVGAVLDSQHITIGKHDQVAPSLDAPVTDGSAIAVRYGKPLHLTVDGKTSTYWVTASHVRGALQQVDRSFNRASLSVSRGAAITRSGLRVSVATPKRLTIVLGRRQAVHRTIAAMTVGQALHRLHVRLGRHDVVRPGLHHRLGNGDKLVLTRIRVVRHQVSGEVLPYATVTHGDSTLAKGQTAVVRSGRSGSRDVTYRLTYRNGRLVARRVVTADVLRAPVAEIERVGTKTVAPTTNFAGGATVWDKIAQCESGGNWATNTGNGYYGGLQFSIGTWHAYGGSGLPSSASRLTQIAIATKVRNATGGYGSWPACSQALGLPQ